jgi:hypothetical protein
VSASSGWPTPLLEVDAENAAGRVVGAAQHQVAADGDDAGSQARQDDRQPLAFSFHRRLAARGLLARAAQPLGHVVERMHQEAHLVARRQRQARAEVALADRAGTRDQVLHRSRELLGGVDSAIYRGKHCQQQHQRQSHPKAVLHRLALR